jgi:hypothetical protein
MAPSILASVAERPSILAVPVGVIPATCARGAEIKMTGTRCTGTMSIGPPSQNRLLRSRILIRAGSRPMHVKPAAAKKLEAPVR